MAWHRDALEGLLTGIAGAGALVGGSDGLLISNLIADHIRKTLNWSLGSALGAILLVIVLVFYWMYNKLIGVDKLKFG